MYACENCKKSALVGIDSSHQYGGGWSMRAQRSRKVWKPNLHTLKIKKAGRTVTMRLCTKCTRKLKADTYKKPAQESAQPAAA